MIKSKIESIVTIEINKNYLVDYKETLKELIHSENFQSSLDFHLKDRDFSVFSLFHIFYDYLFPIHKLSKENFFNSVYSWAINKSFPNKHNLDYNKDDVVLYSLFLNIICKVSSKLMLKGTSFTDNYPISFLTNKEASILNVKHEYFKFKDKYDELYISQIMYLDLMITGHNTLDHVIGVNYISMYISRQLKILGLPIDLGKVVGSSLGHDIGKYGVLEENSNRVPYLHYYYTENWFKRFNMEEIGHIATNHSTWDLELESLPLESLVLIYSDFRVKNKIENGKYNMHIYSLNDSFHVILDKLDNVDEAKENRYKKVYNKLKDFEDYLISLGVDVTLSSSLESSKEKPFELLNNKEIINNMKYMSIDHNIHLMSKLTGNTSFNNILEMARGEENWRKLRLYIEIFKEYSTYLTQKQKITTLNFLSDLLLHTGEDIRKESSELIGRLISLYDEEYKKELPPSIVSDLPQISSMDLFDNFLNILLFPDHKISESNTEWIYNLKTMVSSVFIYSDKRFHVHYFDILIKYYEKCEQLSPLAQFYLSQTINSIPLDSLDSNRLFKLYNYTLKQIDSDDMSIKIGTLDIISQILKKTDNIIFIASIRNWLISNLHKSPSPAENYLKYIIGRTIVVSKEHQLILDRNYKKDEKETSDIFLVNLKSATKWIEKKINIDVLYDEVINNPSVKGLHTAMHLCNILKVSSAEVVRNYSGKTLINIFPFLTMEERNDVCLELTRALEMQSYQFTKFIPRYVGHLLLYLAPTELDEFLDDFEEKIKVSNIDITHLVLNTIAICIENYKSYMERFNENQDVQDQRLTRLMGLLCISMASYNIDVKNEALRMMSSTLFKSDKLNLQDKFNLFSMVGKKILTFLDYNKKDEFLFYNNASSLNHIYKFLSEYQFNYGIISADENNKIAFFPGSFDPFSLSHKNIATEIRDLGFEVYLAVDEFSWSKRTEAHSFRRNIVNMSIANESNIYIFPEYIPINIGNPSDLEVLKRTFDNKDLFMVVGSDVLINASAYKNDNSILSFNHIVFDRKSSISTSDDEKTLEKSISNIKGQVIRLSLPPQYEDISSSKIRENIDLNRDISKLIDPLVQSYIYDYGLYIREPLYKTLSESKAFDVEIFRIPTDEILKELLYNFSHIADINQLSSLRNKRNYKLLIIRDSDTKKVLGFSSFYWIRQNSLYGEFKDPNISEYIRGNVKGRIILISGIYAKENNEYLIEIILNEVLSSSIVRDYNVAIYNNSIGHNKNLLVENHLLLQGFIKTELTHNDNPLFLVDMNNPSTLNLDLISMIKPPYNTDIKILEAIRNTRNKLKSHISSLYPGELLLTYNKNMIYSKLIQNICDANGVSIYQSTKKNLGPNMCVPFGSILKSSIIPNTVTKTMHTEKTFTLDINNFTIKSSPFYLSLHQQAKILKSFNRPVILVDDLLHKGYRINVIEPILREAGIQIEKIIVGILSGRGEEIGISKGIPLDSAYFVPNLKLWFNESSQYPFIGGDMVSNEMLKTNSIPSVNMILPYVSPSFIKKTTNKAIYEFSSICLQNSIDIFKAIEESYQIKNEKSLTLKNLGEIFHSPRHPDTNEMIFLNKNSKPSDAIKIDLAQLKRLENIIIR